MLDFIIKNLATIIISAVLLIVVAAVIFTRLRGRKARKSSCGCGCSSCAASGICHPENNRDSSESEKTHTRR